MGKEQRAVCSGGFVVEVEAAVLFKLGFGAPSRAEEVDVGRNYETTGLWVGVQPGLTKQMFEEFARRQGYGFQYSRSFGSAHGIHSAAKHG